MICFFVVAISTANYSKCDGQTGKGRGKRPREIDSEDEDGLASTILSQSTNVDFSKDKKLLPAISHWIACQTTNGTARSTQSIQAALLKHDVEVTLLRTSYKWGSDVLNKLCKVLKDHKNPCMMQLVATSYHHCLRLVKLQPWHYNNQGGQGDLLRVCHQLNTFWN